MLGGILAQCGRLYAVVTEKPRTMCIIHAVLSSLHVWTTDGSMFAFMDAWHVFVHKMALKACYTNNNCQNKFPRMGKIAKADYDQVCNDFVLKNTTNKTA